MSVNVHFDYFSDNCGDYNKEQGEKSDQDLCQWKKGTKDIET